ncbi:conserved hypothetical protein [Leishmania infantum JPCM5]|uniref:Uncharacterized protein n=2 Tax=Leishmania infantum TaxID=5671 RepID=A4I4D4_LEIIN|nr:conserved hypothetical protein [Leishmania infantum JPCM5]CAC9507674.1 hypothetical_protein_-_conserved [Leishmania infantum]CAM69642.1 conserved hypothetical protein [Leishmania infantum JPCM5]SUZ43581.1 hypothetical_protein_-_conserved [Leishmania infantum]|eukprot:XP_001466603.1 conserved hypothetical protein [Leishmania infantum JPCM5]
MLTSAEEAYTEYLERRVVAGGVDAAIVRATLQQMGFDEKTIAAMMGDTSTYSLPFSTTSSASSTTSTSISSVKKPSRASGFSAATSTPSAPSEMADTAQLHRVVTTSAESAADTPTAASATATQVTPALPSIIPEGKRSNNDANQLCKSSPSATAAPPPSSSTASLSTPSRTLAAGTVAGAAEGFDADHHSGAVLSSRSHAESSVCGTDATQDCAVTLASGASSSTPSEPAAASADEHAQLTAAERTSLARWMREYQALMLSSALPHRGSHSRADATSSSTAPLLPRETPFDEFHALPSAAACCVRTEGGERGGAGAALRDESAAQPLPPWSEAAARVPRKVEDSGSCVAGSDGATSSNGSAFARTEGEHPPYFSEMLCQDGTIVGEQAQSGGANPFSERYYRSAAQPLYRAARSAVPSPIRRAVPKAKSSVFVPTCSIGVPRFATGCARCNFDAAQCRHPYREAQDVRIVRASHVAVTNNGEYNHRMIAQSCCQARQVDAARQAQQTARAQPTSGRLVPVMHAPIGMTIQPRAGLASGRQMSTLPVKAKTDRVRLAQYYRHQWAEQERRSSAAGRSAAWDARYTLLSCAGWTG